MRAPVTPASVRLSEALREPESATTAEARPDERFEVMFEEAQQRAALSGSLAPEDLFIGEVDRNTKQMVLSRLAASFDVTPGPSGPRWTMLNAPRAAILQEIMSGVGLARRLEGKLPPTDSFGDTLRELLRLGSNITLERRLPDLMNLSRAVGAIAPLPIPKPDVERLRQMIERESFLKDFDTLLGRGVIGRDRQRLDLETWVEAPVTATWDGLLLSGFGGAGKSTLLVSFLQWLVREEKAIVALLDFDRPGVNPEDTSWSEFEISRQVGYQRPTLEGEIRKLRRELRESNQGPGDFASYQKVSYERSNRSLMRTLSVELSKQGATTFVLALDTFEKVVERSLESKLIDWLFNLQDALSPLKLKVIFSGRVPDFTQTGVSSVIGDKVVLGDLLATDAQKLLLKFDKMTQALASRIAFSEVLPRRPLELRLLAKLVEQDPHTDLEKLERELREGGPAAQELFAGLVNRRVLERLPEGPVRDLAYPGLILRYLTAEIITEVLVPALELRPLTVVEAQDVLDDLARIGWLVYRKGNEVWHQSELRRSTLAPMLGSDRDRASKIRKKAIQYFEQVPPSGTALPERLGEAMYHRLMRAESSDPGDEFDLDSVKRLAIYFEQSVAELPPTGNAILKLARAEVMAAERIMALPSRFRAEAADMVGRRLCADREFGKAYQLHERTIFDNFWYPVDKGDEPTLPWRREAVFETGHWSKLQDLPPAPIDKDGLKTLARLYPYELATPGNLPARDVADLLSHDSERIKWPTRTRRPGSMQEIQRRYAIVTMLVNARDPFNSRERRTPYELMKLFGEQNEKSVGDTSLVWLARIGRLRKTYRVALRTFDVCLDRRWLKEFQVNSRAIEPPDRALALVSQVLDIMTVTNPPGGRTLLREIDSLDNDRTPRYLKLDGDSDVEALWSSLRGPMPELRNPARYALLERFASPEDHALLGELIQKHIDVKLVDLNPDQFTPTMSTHGEEALASYVELVDRHWQLPEFMDECALVKPGERIEAVRDACHRWADAVHAAIFGADADFLAA